MPAGVAPAGSCSAVSSLILCKTGGHGGSGLLLSDGGRLFVTLSFSRNPPEGSLQNISLCA